MRRFGRLGGPPRPREPGYILIAVLAVIAVLVTVVAVLQYQGMARRRNAVLMEAQYLARRAFDSTESVLVANLEADVPSGMQEIILLENETISFKAGGDPVGSLDSNSVYIDTEVYYRGADSFGAHIFKNPSKRDIGTTDEVVVEPSMHGRDRKTIPFGFRVEGQPTSWNPTFDLFRRNRFQTVYQSGFPYAAFAPGANARVEIEKVRTWAMPTMEEYDPEEVNPLDLDSGISPFVGAGGDVVVHDFEYGQAYSKTGTIEVGRGEAIGFSGYLPFESWGKSSYFSHLTASMEKVAKELDSVSTDKTAAIFGKLDLAETVNWIVKGKTPSNFLTYQAASAWWFFLMPSIKTAGPTVEISLHLPLPADTGIVADAAGSAPAIVQISTLTTENQKLQNELLPNDVPEDESDWNETTSGLIPELSWKAKEYETLNSELEKLEQEYQELVAGGADGGQLDTKQKQIDAQRDKVEEKQEEAEELDQKVQRKQDQIEENETVIDTLREQLEDTASDWIEGDPKGPTQVMETIMAKIPAGGNAGSGELTSTKPTNASKQDRPKDDKTKWLSSKGMLYHSYAAIIERLGAQIVHIIKDAITSFPMRKIKINIGIKKIKFKIPDLSKLDTWIKDVGLSIAEGLQNLVVYEVPLVYLDALPLEKITGKNFKIYDTFQVPMGRTFKLDGDMTIYGDLWLQKGSSMTLTGDLVMKQPNLDDAMVLNFHSMMIPQGRIYMEEGTSLVVEGDLLGAGDKFMGSVVACGPMGKNRGITAVILCDGRVELPFGTASGIGFVELVEWIGTDNQTRDMRRLFEDWIPNLSKFPMFLGPFWPRLPYFGRYPVFLKVIPPSPYPIPTFELKDDNMNIGIFRILTYTLTAQLNLVLGENFSTNNAWWAWSGEQVAVFPKHAGPSFKPEVQKRLNEFLDSFQWAGDDFADTLEPLIEESIKQVRDIPALGKSLALCAAAGMNPDPTGQSNQLVEDMLHEFSGVNSIKVKAEKVMDELDMPISVPGGIDIDIWGGLKDELRNIQDAVNALSPSTGIPASDSQLRESANVLLLESPGVFVYGKDSLNIGAEGGARAVGCFVSDGDINIDVPYTIGSILSGEGNITAKQLYYTPHYSRASVYIPKKLRKGGGGIGANDDLWDNAANLKYGSKLDTETGMDIPENTVFFPAAFGWGP
jgi:hypothetical protein